MAKIKQRANSPGQTDTKLHGRLLLSLFININVRKGWKNSDKLFSKNKSSVSDLSEGESFRNIYVREG